MRVLHVINQFSGRAGAEISLRDIIVGTQGDELQHGVAVLGTANNDFSDLEALAVETFTPSTLLRSTVQRVAHVSRAARAFRPDLIHTSLFQADVAGRIVARRAGLPVLVSLVNTPYTPMARPRLRRRRLKLVGVRAVDRLLSRHATSAFHAITEAVADAAVVELGIDRARITVIPRGRSLERLGRSSAERRTRVRAELGVGTDAPVLVNVARQEPQKGQLHLLEALPFILREFPDVVLLLVGREGSSTPELRRGVETLGLAPHVRALGVRRDVGDLLVAADVFVFPSLYEGLGGAVLEAMALGVPIVASSSPAVAEVLEDGRCGILVPPADAMALATGVLEVLAEGQTVSARVDAAHERFSRMYELGLCLARMRELYLQVGRTAGGVGGANPMSSRPG